MGRGRARHGQVKSRPLKQATGISVLFHACRPCRSSRAPKGRNKKAQGNALVVAHKSEVEWFQRNRESRKLLLQSTHSPYPLQYSRQTDTCKNHPSSQGRDVCNNEGNALGTVPITKSEALKGRNSGPREPELRPFRASPFLPTCSPQGVALGFLISPLRG